MSTTLARGRSLHLQPLDVLLDITDSPAFDLPDELTRLGGRPLGFETPRLYANFVVSLDGVTAIATMSQSNHLLAAGSEHDRSLMGLLRACADVILIGAGSEHGAADAPDARARLCDTSPPPRCSDADAAAAPSARCREAAST